MFPIRMNMHLLRMKLHYFFYLGGTACIFGFAPTVAKQLGYSPLIVGSLYTYLAILGFLIRPVCGLFVDKFPVKRSVFLTFISLAGLTAFALKFVHKPPTEVSVADLSCDETITSLNFCTVNSVGLCADDSWIIKALKNNTNPVTCQLFCQKNELLWSEICTSWSIIDYCTPLNNNFENNNLGFFNVSMFISAADQGKNSTVFQIKSVQTSEKEVFFPVCQNPANTQCEVKCNVNAIAASVSYFQRNIFSLYQFWELFVVMSLIWISQTVTWCLQDSICFDLLGNKTEDFGKQRCWGSISWGCFSIFGGVLVDYFSVDNSEKNYEPIFYLCLLTTLCDFVVAYKIKVTETVGSKNTFTDIYKLFTQLNVIVFFVWIIVLGMCMSMVWNYLFWYMEDITAMHRSDKQPWIKTLQGAAIGVECALGEMPLMFFSGRIIRWIGHWHCMSLGLFVFAARFYAYSVITDPVWILPVELTHGITFGLSNAVLLSYARNIAPASAVTTVLSVAGALFEGVGVSLGGFVGGFLYEKYGGAQTFKLFSYGALSICILHALFTKFNKKKVEPEIMTSDS